MKLYNISRKAGLFNTIFSILNILTPGFAIIFVPLMTVLQRFLDPNPNTSFREDLLFIFWVFVGVMVGIYLFVFLVKKIFDFKDNFAKNIKSVEFTENEVFFEFNKTKNNYSVPFSEVNDIHMEIEIVAKQFIRDVIFHISLISGQKYSLIINDYKESAKELISSLIKYFEHYGIFSYKYVDKGGLTRIEQDDKAETVDSNNIDGTTRENITGCIFLSILLFIPAMLGFVTFLFGGYSDFFLWSFTGTVLVTFFIDIGVLKKIKQFEKDKNLFFVNSETVAGTIEYIQNTKKNVYKTIFAKVLCMVIYIAIRYFVLGY